MRAMAKDRSRRYQTMAEVEGDLERLLAGDQNVGFVPRARGRATKATTAPRRWPLLAAGGAVAGGARSRSISGGRRSRRAAPPRSG